MKIAYYLPERDLPNSELSALYPEWPPEKILAKTGISSRHVAGANETAVDLAEQAAKRLFARGDVIPSFIVLLLLIEGNSCYRVAIYPFYFLLISYIRGLMKPLRFIFDKFAMWCEFAKCHLRRDCISISSEGSALNAGYTKMRTDR